MNDMAKDAFTLLKEQYMKSLMSFYSEILAECGDRCGISTTRDWKTIESRFEHEGLSFLTITLSNFGKDFEKSLDQGYVAHHMFYSFHKRKNKELPLFLGGFLGLVFDDSSGVLLDDPDVEAIFIVRQLTLMFSKIAIDCTERRTRQAISRWIQCEQELRETDKALESGDLSDFLEYRPYFGPTPSQESIKTSTREKLSQSTDLGLPLRKSWLTLSILRLSGLRD